MSIIKQPVNTMMQVYLLAIIRYFALAGWGRVVRFTKIRPLKGNKNIFCCPAGTKDEPFARECEALGKYSFRID